jgi:hypothetical protein
MAYVRQRKRLIAMSVFRDLQDTLIACRWLAGTTAHSVRHPDTAVWAAITTGPTQTYAALKNSPIKLIDFFPEAEGSSQTPNVAMNTLAMDQGRSGDAVEAEMGSRLMEQPWVFNFAFYAVSDAAAIAVFNDLEDRYYGRIVDGDGVNIYNYLSGATTPIGRLEVDSFRWSQNAEVVAPAEVHLYFAELNLTDTLD